MRWWRWGSEAAGGSETGPLVLLPGYHLVPSGVPPGTTRGTKWYHQGYQMVPPVESKIFGRIRAPLGWAATTIGACAALGSRYRLVSHGTTRYHIISPDNTSYHLVPPPGGVGDAHQPSQLLPTACSEAGWRGAPGGHCTTWPAHDAGGQGCRLAAAAAAAARAAAAAGARGGRARGARQLPPADPSAPPPLLPKHTHAAAE